MTAAPRPSSLAAMRENTLATVCCALREKSQHSMRSAAKACGLTYTSVWKPEAGIGIKWETLHKLITGAYGVKEDSKKYQEIFDLWGKERAHKKRPKSHGKRTKEKEYIAAVQSFRRALYNVPPDDIPRIMKKIMKALQ